MKLLKGLLATALVGGTVVGGTATWLHYGVPPAEEPQGISLRQESERTPGGFFPLYRSHRGGGLRGGK